MTVRNTLLTAAKAKKFDKDGFSENWKIFRGLTKNSGRKIAGL